MNHKPRRRPGGRLGSLLAVWALACAPLTAGAVDLPHTDGPDFCANCHMLHSAPGDELTSQSGNGSLCQSCHVAGGQASASPLPNSQQAQPGPGLPAGASPSGNSHRWDSGPAGHLQFLGGAAAASTGTLLSTGLYTGPYAKTYTLTITTPGNAGTARFNWTATLPGGGAGTNLLTGSQIALDQGVSAVFLDGAGTSFQSGDQWNILVRSDLRFPTNAALLGRLDRGQMLCSTCHDQHSQANPPFGPNVPSYGGTNTGVGRHYMRLANDKDQMCVDCHAARNVISSSGGSHPVGVFVPTNTYYRRPAALPLDASEGKMRCSTCHQMHYGPASDGSLARLSLTNQVAFCADCHRLADTNTPAAHLNRTNGVLWPGGQYGSLFPAITNPAMRGACDNCHQAHGWPNATNTAAHYPKLLVETEENVCFTCHDTNGPAAMNVKDDFAKPLHHLINDLQQPPGRPVECRDCHNPHQAMVGSHTFTNTATSARNQVSNPLKGVSGVAVSYAGLGNFVAPAAGNYAATNTAAYEYQICFKCHSGYAYGTSFPAGLSPYYRTGTATFTAGSATVTGSGTSWNAGMVGSWIRRTNEVTNYRITAVASGTSLTISPAYAGTTGSGQLYVITLETDLAQEFSPMNRSGHPIVTGLDNYPNSIAVGSPSRKGLQPAALKAPWNVNVGSQTMMCSDCHNTDAATPAAQGPHGSAAQFMLRGPNAANWPNVTSFSTSWCANCHNDSAGVPHTRSNHRVACYTCHVVIPHGSKMSRLIADRDGTMPARYAYNNNLTTVGMMQYTKAATGSYTENNNCRTSCGHHGEGTGNENW